MPKPSEILGPNPRIALVCRGGPENGPFSAMAAKVITEVLKIYDYKVSGIYTCSGSVTTGLLGCINEYDKLCLLWKNTTPEDIVGKKSKLKVTYRVINGVSFFPSDHLRKKIEHNLNLDKIFSDEAILTKFPTVDCLSSEYIIFSNKDPKYREWFIEGVLGSKALVPFLEPQIIRNPEASGLLKPGKARLIDQNSRLLPPEAKPYKAALLIDGGYIGNMLLEEAQRDGFNVVFLIDIHGLEATETDLSMKQHWTSFTRIGHHILSNTNDRRQFQHSGRINEEIDIKEKLTNLANELGPEQAAKARQIIDQMNNGRLRLGDKTKTLTKTVSSRENSTLFNFARFSPKEVQDLMDWGREAGVKALQELGFKTHA